MHRKIGALPVFVRSDKLSEQGDLISVDPRMTIWHNDDPTQAGEFHDDLARGDDAHVTAIMIGCFKNRHIFVMLSTGLCCFVSTGKTLNRNKFYGIELLKKHSSM